MSEINLGALTAETQKIRKGIDANYDTEKASGERIIPTDDKGEDVAVTRIVLTEANRKNLDILRLSSPDTALSRTELVNRIIAQYFEDHSDVITTNIKSLLRDIEAR